MIAGPVPLGPAHLLSHFFFSFFKGVCVCVGVRTHACSRCVWVPKEAREGIRSLGSGLTVGGVLSAVMTVLGTEFQFSG